MPDENCKNSAIEDTTMSKKNEKLAEDSIEQEDSSVQDEQLIKDYINELIERFKEKREKRYLHNIANIDYPDEDLFARLDTSIKKNTAFVKKMRNMTESNKEIIMKDLENLNLSRYISELAIALVETKIKANEIPMFIQICSFLHLRYSDFSAQLLESWIKNLPRKPSDTFNASKMRIDIKIFTELILCGIFITKDSLPTLGNLLTILTIHDKEAHKNLNILIAFCRTYCVEFAGLYPRKMRILAEKHSLELPTCDFLTVERQKGVRNLLKEYHQSLKTHISKDYKYLFHMKNDMKRNLETRGEVSDSLQEKWKTRSSEFEKLYAAATSFADLIDDDMPDIETATLENDSILMKTENVTAVLFDLNRFKENNSTLWDDEETRTFYENMPDLKSLVPVMLYKESLKDDPNANVKENCDSDQELLTLMGNDDESKSDSTSILEINDLTNMDETIIDTKDVPLLNENDDGESDQKEEKKNDKAMKFNFNATKDQLDSFFSSLPNCVNRDLIDKAALQFATTFNTKNNRKKLVNVLITVPRTRLDLLPFYSRFVAQLAPIMPSVASDLCVALKNQFRYNFIKKDQVNIESKVKIVRFIGELVKFNIFSKTEVHKIFKTLLSDFHHHHIEMTCNLFEVCGQFLYRCPDSHHMTNLLLQQMMRLKTHMYVNTRYETMIQNSFYLVTPEDKLTTRNVQSKPVVHQYIEHLIYKELNNKNILIVSKKLRRINWNNKETSAFAINCLSSAWNVKFYNINALAHLLTNISQHQSKVVLMVLDTVLEDIRLGMQINSFEFNQRRISMIKYFSECFNYNLIDSTLLFSVMYSLITYGINYSDITQSIIDPPFNLMRLRLVAQILHTCGLFLLSSPAKKKLEYFLYFFQRYYWFKKSYLNSLPVDQVDQNALFYIDAIFKDVIHFLKPKFRIAGSYETACQQLESRIKELADNAKDILPNTKISVQNVLLNSSSLSDQMAKSRLLSNTIDGLEPIKEDSEEEHEQDDSETININNHNVNNEAQDSESNNSELDVDGGDDDNSEEEINNNIDYDGSPPRENSNKDLSDSDSESIEYNNMNNNNNNNSKAIARLHQCEEDDEFQKDFEKLLNENLASRSQEVIRSANVEIAIPIERDTDNKAKNNSFSFESPSNCSKMMANNIQHQPPESFNFRVMTKNSKSNKPVLKSIKVPANSELVQNFLAREQAHRVEKEQVKKLILNINERRELEDSVGNSSNNDNQHNSVSRTHGNSSQRYHNQGNYGYRKRF